MMPDVPERCPFCGAALGNVHIDGSYDYDCFTWFSADGQVKNQTYQCAFAHYQVLKRELTAARAEAKLLRQQNAVLRPALAELVTLKDKVKSNNPDDYERRKPRAWQAAREALERVQETGVLLTGEECLILSFGLTDPYLLDVDDLTDEAWDRYRALYKRIVWKRS